MTARKRNTLGSPDPLINNIEPTGLMDPGPDTPMFSDYVAPSVEPIHNVDTDFFYYRGVRYFESHTAENVRTSESEMLNIFRKSFWLGLEDLDVDVSGEGQEQYFDSVNDDVSTMFDLLPEDSFRPQWQYSVGVDDYADEQEYDSYIDTVRSIHNASPDDYASQDDTEDTVKIYAHVWEAAFVRFFCDIIPLSTETMSPRMNRLYTECFPRLLRVVYANGFTMLYNAVVEHSKHDPKTAPDLHYLWTHVVAVDTENMVRILERIDEDTRFMEDHEHDTPDPDDFPDPIVVEQTREHEDFMAGFPAREVAPQIEKRTIPATIYRVHDTLDGGMIDYKDLADAVRTFHQSRDQHIINLHSARLLMGAVYNKDADGSSEDYARGTHLDALISSYTFDEITTVFYEDHLIDMDAEEDQVVRDCNAASRFGTLGIYRNLYAQSLYKNALMLARVQTEDEENADDEVDLSIIPLDLAASMVDTESIAEEARALHDKIYESIALHSRHTRLHIQDTWDIRDGRIVDVLDI